MHEEQYQEFLFEITDDVKGVLNEMIVQTVEKDVKNLCEESGKNNIAAIKRT